MGFYEERMAALQALKEGDQVAVFSHYQGYSVATIKKITPTGIIVLEDGKRFKNGSEMGDHARFAHPDTIEPLTEKVKAIMERQRKVKAIKNFLAHVERVSWEQISMETIDGIYEAIKPRKEQ